MKTKLLIIVGTLLCYNSFGQNPIRNPMLKSCLDAKEINFRVKDENFKKFLRIFYSLRLPLNITKAMNKYYYYFPENAEEIRVGTIKDEYVVKYYGVKKEELMDTFRDEETGEISNRKESWWAAQSYFLNHMYIVAIVMDGKLSGALNRTYISIFDNSGNLITKQILIKNLNAYHMQNLIKKTDLEDMTLYSSESYVLVDKHHYKVFRYSLNEANVKKQLEYKEVEYKDLNAPKAKCIITDYEITDEGKITKQKVHLPILLKNDPWEYTKDFIKPDENLDDPINKY